MHKDTAFEHIKKATPTDEELIGYFMATKPFKIWLFVVIGPLAALSMKQYFVAITNAGVHFYKLNLLGKFSQHDFFSYDEIESIKIGKGAMWIPMKFKFASGRKLKVKAQKKGLDRVAKIDDKTLEYIKQNIALD